jgi:methylmalonyl-CoA mutase
LRQDVVVGINQYVNAAEGVPETRAVDGKALASCLGPKAAARRQGKPASAAFGDLVAAAPQTTLSALVAALGRKGETKVEPLVFERAAESYESLREAVLAWRAKVRGPQVFLANLGPIGAYMPRLDFTRGFFQVGGFEVASEQWWKTPEEASAAALASGAPVVVLVGLDETYVEGVPVAAKAMKAAGKPPRVIVAGFPKDHIDAMKAAGVDDFIHIKSDVHAVLSGLAREMGAL